MKSSLIFGAALSFLSLFNITTAQLALVDLDCSSVEGFQVMTKVPSGVKAEDSFGWVKISNGAKFQMELNEVFSYDLTKAKKELAANDVNKLKNTSLMNQMASSIRQKSWDKFNIISCIF